MAAENKAVITSFIWNRGRPICRPQRARRSDRLDQRGEYPDRSSWGAASVRMLQPGGVSALGLPDGQRQIDGSTK
jgi:hypothetical protein